MNIIEKTKQFFYEKIDEFGTDPYTLLWHLPEVENRANFCLKEIPADKEIVLLWVWLHDIWHYPIPTEIDHAVRGEEIANEFLKNNWYDKEKTAKVVHCVRSHRCKDVQPETIEAKIIAFSDSASHMTQTDLYLWMAKRHGTDKTLEKLERDYRDLEHFPALKEKLHPLYIARKNLLETYENVMKNI